MKELTGQHLLEHFFARMPHGKPVLLLDYDGTLAPFQTDRNSVVFHGGVKERLEEIIRNGKTFVSIISGRALENLVSRLDLTPLPDLWGSHGIERLKQNGEYLFFPLKKSQQKGLEQAVQMCQSHSFSHQCEVKPASIAVHWRGLAAEKKHAIKKTVVTVWEELEKKHDLMICPFNEGVELRPKGKTKGDAIKAILAEIDHPVAAYLGDDATDEDAFEVLGSKGLKVLVSPDEKPTFADIQLYPPDELLLFLDKWLEAVKK